MTNIKEKVAYLQGLSKGLNVDGATAEGKLLMNIVEVLNDFAQEIHEMDCARQDLENYVETIDEDLTDLEEEVYEDEAVDEFVEIECPYCHETVSFEAELLDDDEALEVTCPHCGEVVYDNTLEDAYLEESPPSAGSSRRGPHPGI